MKLPGLPNYSIGFDTAAVDGNTDPDAPKPNAPPCSPNYQAAKEAGASFCYLKRSQHVFPDTYYARDAENARKAGLVVGSYLFPGWGPRAASAKSQVIVFKTAGGEIIKGVDLPPAIDVESGGQWGGIAAASIVEQVRQLVFEVEDQLGVSPALYTSFMQWYDLNLPNAAWMARCALWIKTAYRLNAREPVDQVAPVEPHFGPDTLRDPRDYWRAPDPWAKAGWVIQQFQGDSIGFPGHSRTVDVNRFHNLRVGYDDPLVGWMQAKLCHLVNSTLVVDNDFGPKTEEALVTFQTQRGIRVTRELDPRTFAALWWS